VKNLTWQNPEQLFVAQELINKVKSKCCGIKDRDKNKIVITATLCSIRLYSTLAFIFLKFRHLVQEI